MRIKHKVNKIEAAALKVRCNAHHECGHAIAAHLHGVATIEVLLFKRGSSMGGYCLYEADSHEALKYSQPEKEMLLTVAGDAAGEIFTGKPSKLFDGSMSDYRKLKDYYGLPADQLLYKREALIAEAKALLLPYKSQLETLAADLLATPYQLHPLFRKEARRLDGSRVQEVMSQ
jgi:hypothetical protein